MKNNFFVISCPIGNINDCSQNMINTLESLEVLYCEDTRNTSKLLTLLNIKNQPKLISYHKFNENEITSNIIDTIKIKKCGLISDAGYPTICDPGYLLINECHKNNINVRIINGPSAIMHSIVQSGFCSHGFCFIGFLPQTKNELINLIDKYKFIKLPLVCFESVHRINKTINLLKEIIPNAYIYIGRELTKKFEEYSITKISEISSITEKGEFSLVINVNNNEEQKIIEDDILINEIKQLVALDMKYKNACKYVGDKYNMSTNMIYKKFLNKI